MTFFRSGRGRGRRLTGLTTMAALFAGIALLTLSPALADDVVPHEEITVVRHVLTMAPDGSVAIEEEDRTTVSAAFKVNTYQWAKNTLPVEVAYNPSGEPSGMNVPQILQDAMAKWNAVPSSFSFAWAGTTTSETGSCLDGADFVTDGTNTVRFKNLPGLTLGRTCTIFAGGKIKEFDMELDGDGTWSSATPVPSSAYDLPTTVLHELGHALGLGHSCGDTGAPPCGSAYLKSVMYRQIAAGESRRELTADDISGLQSAYPSTATPTATPTAPLPPLNFRIRAPLLSRD